MPPSDLDPKTIYAHLLKVAPAGETVTEGGSLKEGERLAQTTYDATYRDHYMAHAAIETHTALARFEGGRMTVWASTQNPFGAKEEIARALALSAQKVRVMTPFVGGGFGGKTFNLQAVEAARLAKLTGRPVQVAWTREEEFFYDTFRPAGIGKNQVRNGQRRPDHALGLRCLFLRSKRRRSSSTPYPTTVSCPTAITRGLPGAHPFRTGAWRAPGANFNVFARESHIDTMAAKLGIDPVEFRLKNLSEKRMQRVLGTAAERFGWKKGAAPSGRGIGVACAEDAGTYLAAIGEVDVDRATGRVRVKRIVCAQDMGVVINPDGATIQMEGALTMGLGQALTEEVPFKGGDVLVKNFDTYDIPRFSWLPKIETVLVENHEVPPQGGGEPPITVVAAVVGNAIFDAVGARLSDLPMTPERVKEALAAKH